LEVTRSPFGTIGYEWTITFTSKVSSRNAGNQVALYPVSISADPAAKVDVL